MINIIILKLIVFFIILFYFFVITSLLIAFLNPEVNHTVDFANSYVWSIFGGIEGGSFTEFDYITIPIVFGSVIVMVVLLNILIALLSNVYALLEEQQVANDIREKARMILDYELTVHFFKYVITGKKRIIKELDQYVDKYHYNLINNSKTDIQRLSSAKTLSTSQFDTLDIGNTNNFNKNLKKKHLFENNPIKDHRKYFLIITKNEYNKPSAENTVDDNIFKKVKYLGKVLTKYVDDSKLEMKVIANEFDEQYNILEEKLNENNEEFGQLSDQTEKGMNDLRNQQRGFIESIQAQINNS
jgi:hypothetical protein